MPLIIILAECGIELIPKEIKNHPSIKKHLDKRNFASQLLDNALHHSAMVKLKDFNKRGRPDITHNCLLNALGSPLNKNKQLIIYIHTINNKIFKITPDIKITRNYNRFKGLMAKLLIDAEIKVNNLNLIVQFEGDLKDLIKLYKNKQIMIFSSKGRLISYHLDLFHEDISKNCIAIIGGFQKGTFSNEIYSLSKNVISISPYSLDAWNVVNKIITFYEITHNIS
ncbi:MAG: 16S rRNA methyltransferase [Promethearchaeota archaeon]